jgi:hypothetical protein
MGGSSSVTSAGDSASSICAMCSVCDVVVASTLGAAAALVVAESMSIASSMPLTRFSVPPDFRFPFAFRAGGSAGLPFCMGVLLLFGTWLVLRLVFFSRISSAGIENFRP